jgi:hypothetical protein
MNFITPAFERFLADNNITVNRIEPHGDAHRFDILFDCSGRTVVVSFRKNLFASRRRRPTVIHKLRYALRELAA